MKLILTPFTGDPEHRIFFAVSNTNGTLTCDYSIEGNTADIMLAEATGGARKMYLWLTTCFELFIRPDGGTAYYEFNFAPNGDYNIFRFEVYRGPLVESNDFTACSRIVTLDREHLHFRAEITPAKRFPLRGFSFLPSMVLKLKTGDEFFLASHHSSPNADFHDHNTYKNRLEF